MTLSSNCFPSSWTNETTAPFGETFSTPSGRTRSENSSPAGDVDLTWTFLPRTRGKYRVSGRHHADRVRPSTSTRWGVLASPSPQKATIRPSLSPKMAGKAASVGRHLVHRQGEPLGQPLKRDRLTLGEHLEESDRDTSLRLRQGREYRPRLCGQPLDVLNIMLGHVNLPCRGRARVAPGPLDGR